MTQVGEVHGDLHVNAQPPARSHYLAQVAGIAPDALVDRDRELADLADFCTSPTTNGRYRYLRADAWSGKTALLQWFVLHPPPDVVVVSFFITVRLPGQHDRRAFVDTVLEQLAALQGEPPPQLLAEATREAHLLSLLARAARDRQDRGEHLVLVVDGLDEDLGVHGGPDAHSVAALLPVTPPPGLRLIVSGRPHPPVPFDVPDRHPLRDPATDWPLTPSPRAQVLRDVMTRDLKRLLSGTPVEQDILGFLGWTRRTPAISRPSEHWPVEFVPDAYVAITAELDLIAALP
ncbi:MAG: hypothetical protein HOY78_10325 [Saccharothrix sp.]|nr:hypothetical protein [Saccharothrix sp.]